MGIRARSRSAGRIAATIGGLAVLISSLASLAPPVKDAGASGVPGRPTDPVVLTGDDVGPLAGVHPDLLVAFAWGGSWSQIPVQVDERKMIDYGTIREFTGNGRTFQGMGYADATTHAGADPDPLIDPDDEVAFMAFDAGTSAAGRADPDGTVAGTRIPVRIQDPLEPSNTRFVYLFQTDGSLSPEAGQDYVDYDFALRNGLSYPDDYNFAGEAGTAPSPRDNPEDSRVETDVYELDFPGRWVTDEMRIRAGGATGVDILDGDKITVGLTTCGRNEDTFQNGGGGFIANIDGPVRAIRSYTGANSGNHTQRDHVLYRSRQEMTSFLRVHPGIDNMLSAFDFSSAAIGMSYSNSANSGSFTIDGIPDLPASGFLDWEQVRGPQGSMVNVSRLSTDIPGVIETSFYLDQLNVPSPHSILCSGDEHAYGASGPMVQGTGAYNTDPTRLAIDGSVNRLVNHRTTIFDAPSGEADPEVRARQVDSPLTVETGAGVDRIEAPPAAEARLSLRIDRKQARLAPGRKLTVKVVAGNSGSAAALGSRLCVRVQRRLVRAPACLRIGRIEPQRWRLSRVRLRLSRRQGNPRPVRVWFDLRSDSTRRVSRALLIRPLPPGPR